MKVEGFIIAPWATRNPNPKSYILRPKPSAQQQAQPPKPRNPAKPFLPPFPGRQGSPIKGTLKGTPLSGMPYRTNRADPQESTPRPESFARMTRFRV